MKTTETMTTKPAQGYESNLDHFNKVIGSLQPEGAYTPDFKRVKYALVKRRHHLGSGVYQPYLAIRATRIADGKVLYTKPASIIRWEDGSASVWWYGCKSEIFAIDNARMPKGY